MIDKNKTDKQFQEMGLENAKMVDKMHKKFNQPYNFNQAVNIVLEHGGNDLLFGMQRIKEIRIDDIYDEDDAKRREYLVSAYRVVHENMNKLFNGNII